MVGYKGKGVLFLEFNYEVEQLEVNFDCTQKSDSIISGWIDFTEQGSIDFFKKWNKGFQSIHFEGRTEEGYSITIDHIKFSRIHMGTLIGQSVAPPKKTKPDIEFVAIKMTVINNLSEYDKLKFGIINLDSFGTVSTKFLDGKIVFRSVDNYKELIENIRTDSLPKLTAIAEYAVSLGEVFNPTSLEKIHHELFKVLELTSFAQGITQGFCYTEAYSTDNFLYGEYNWIKTRKQKFYPTIWISHLPRFLEISYSQYSDEYREKNGLQLFIELYLEALSSLNCETKIILYFTALEHVLYYYKTSKDKNEIIEQTEFDSLRGKIRDGISKILKEAGIPDEKRARVYEKILELNRYAMRIILEEYLAELKITYNDLFDRFGDLKEVRDQIIHRGKAECDTQTLMDTERKIEALLHRIFFSLFNYDGENWINCYYGYRYDKFNREGYEKK